MFNTLTTKLLQGVKTYFLSSEKMSLIFDSFTIGNSNYLIFLYSNNIYMGYIVIDEIEPRILNELKEGGF